MKVTPERLKALRTEYQINQADFGLRLGYPVGSSKRPVSRMENGGTITGQIDLIIRYIERYGFLD